MALAPVALAPAPPVALPPVALAPAAPAPPVSASRSLPKPLAIGFEPSVPAPSISASSSSSASAFVTPPRSVSSSSSATAPGAPIKRGVTLRPLSPDSVHPEEDEDEDKKQDDPDPEDEDEDEDEKQDDPEPEPEPEPESESDSSSEYVPDEPMPDADADADAASESEKDSDYVPDDSMGVGVGEEEEDKHASLDEAPQAWPEYAPFLRVTKQCLAHWRAKGVCAHCRSDDPPALTPHPTSDIYYHPDCWEYCHGETSVYDSAMDGDKKVSAQCSVCGHPNDSTPASLTHFLETHPSLACETANCPWIECQKCARDHRGEAFLNKALIDKGFPFFCCDCYPITI